MLSTFWFLYMAGMGVFFPFFALYLRENAGLDGSQTGAVFAMLPAVSLVAPAFWGRVADRSGAPARVLAGVLAGAAVGHLILARLDGFAALVAGTALLAFFSTASMPLGIAVSLSALGADARYRFGLVRVWGTVGFLVLVVAFPWVTPLFGPPNAEIAASEISAPGLGWMFPIAAGFTFAASLLALALPTPSLPAISGRLESWRSLRGNVPLRRMLLYGFLAYLFLQGPMNFFPAYVRDRGGTIDTLSLLWLVMLIPEIPLVALTGAGLRRLGARRLLAGGVLAGALRWIICALTTSPAVIFPLQALHGVLVAGLLIGGPLYLDAVVSPRLRSTAQGLLAMAGVGVGGIASSIATGWLFDRIGVDAAYLVGGLGALVLGLATPWILPLPAREVES